MPSRIDGPVSLTGPEIEALPWSPIEGGQGHEKVLARDPDSGATTRLLRLDADERLPAATEPWWDELYVLTGALVDGETFGPGSFRCLARGESAPLEAGPEGAVVLHVQDVGDRLQKPSVSFTGEQLDQTPWEQMAGRGDGFEEKVLVEGPCGSKTHIVRITPHGDAKPNSRHRESHEFGEEMYALGGAYRDGDELLGEGTYTNNPPGTEHGPFVFDRPYLCIEIKNFT